MRSFKQSVDRSIESFKKGEEEEGAADGWGREGEESRSWVAQKIESSVNVRVDDGELMDQISWGFLKVNGGSELCGWISFGGL